MERSPLSVATCSIVLYSTTNSYRSVFGIRHAPIKLDGRRRWKWLAGLQTPPNGVRIDEHPTGTTVENLNSAVVSPRTRLWHRLTRIPVLGRPICLILGRLRWRLRATQTGRYRKVKSTGRNLRPLTRIHLYGPTVRQAKDHVRTSSNRADPTVIRDPVSVDVL